MSERGWKLFLRDIFESIEKIETYVKGISFDEFMDDAKTQDAVVRNLEIIGEASNKIPKDIQHRYTEIPWTQIVGMRNRLIHAYFVVDHEIVWEIITKELPELKKEISKILEEIE